MAPRKFKPVPEAAAPVEPVIAAGPKPSVTIKKTGNGKVETITRKNPATNTLVEWVAEQID